MPRRWVCIGVVGIGLVSSWALVVLPQETVSSAQNATNMVLSYIHTAATYVGKGLVGLLNLITNGRVSSALEEPVGYLGLITALLLVFGIIEAARKIIWVAIGVGWILLIVRIILDALSA